MMRFWADYTLGLAIVLFHLVAISLRGEELQLSEHADRLDALSDA